MRFLADESCDFAVVLALRSLGHDVAAVSEFQQRSVDQEVMEAAFREGRILLTEDKDFGWLAFVAHAGNPRLVAEFGAQLNGAFVVLSPGSVRISRVPPVE